MQNKKSSNRESQGFRRTEYLFLPLLLLLTGCSTTNIPGLDRVFFPNSSAKVGPLITSQEQYPASNSGSTESSIEPNIEPNKVQAEDVTKAVNTVSKDSAPSPELEANKEVQKAGPETVLQASINEPRVQVSKAETAKAIEDKAIEDKAIEDKTPKVAASVKANESVPEPAPIKETIEHGVVSGQVVIVGDDGKSITAQGTLVTLMPKESTDEAEKRQPKTHVIDMEDKEYQPQYSTINAGDQVVFVNKDNIQHNVFSPSGNNAFDLGTYGAGLKRAVTLSEPGIVKVYCNIHADMATFVAVGDPGMSIKADEQGRYRIDNVPPGTYDMTIWNIRGETTRTVEVKSNETVKLVDRINTVAVKTETHKNKFGGNYSKNSALFEDEFY